MDRIFEQELTFGFNQCDAHKNASFSQLLSVTSEAAGDDFTVQGFSWDYLQTIHICMLVSRLSFKLYKIPRENQKVKIKTWEEKARALQCMRRYDLYDAQTDELLLTGLSSWLIVDPETRRIQKPSVFTARPLPEKETPFDGIDCGKIHHSENEKVLDERLIRFSDIDANGHVNNSRYGDFFADALPKEFHEKTVTDFRLNYAKECREGDVLKIFGEVSEDNTKITMTAKIEASDEICFEAEAFFK